MVSYPDRNGTPLKVGDEVLLRCRVVAIDVEGPAHIRLETVYPEPALGADEEAFFTPFTLSSFQLEKVAKAN